jgi:hypothetical protein
MGRFCFLVLLLSTGIAAADPQPWTVGVTDDQKTKAKLLLDEGNALLIDKKYVEALEKYTEAVGVWDHPAIRFNMVRCEVFLDRIVEASDNLEKALKYGAAPLEETVYQEALSFQRLLANQIGTVEVECGQSDVALTLDGKPLATCPTKQTRKLRTGAHQIVGKKQGLLTKTVELDVFGGKTDTISITLDPLAKGARVVHRYPGYVPWVVFAAGAAFAATGTVLQVSARSEMDSYDALVDQRCGTRCEAAEISDIADIKRGAERRSQVGVSMIAIGSAGVVAGAVLLYLNRGRTVYPSETITPAPLPGGGVAVSWGKKF